MLHCKFSGDYNGKRIFKIGQYLTKLCVEHLGFTFLAHPVLVYSITVVCCLQSSPPKGIVIKPVCWLVRWFVHDARCDSSKSRPTSPIFTKFGTDVQRRCQFSIFNVNLTFHGTRSKFEVKTAVLKIFQL